MQQISTIYQYPLFTVSPFYSTILFFLLPNRHSSPSSANDARWRFSPLWLHKDDLPGSSTGVPGSRTFLVVYVMMCESYICPLKLKYLFSVCSSEEELIETLKKEMKMKYKNGSYRNCGN